MGATVSSLAFAACSRRVGSSAVCARSCAFVCILRAREGAWCKEFWGRWFVGETRGPLGCCVQLLSTLGRDGLVVASYFALSSDFWVVHSWEVRAGITFF